MIQPSTDNQTDNLSAASVFIQDSPGFVAKGYSSIKDNLGIIDKSSKRWANVLRRLRILNQQADDLTAYKLVFIARHGEVRFGTFRL